METQTCIKQEYTDRQNLERAEVQQIYRPIKILPLGLDGLPTSLLNSQILSGNDLQKLARLEFLPSEASIEKCATRYRLTKGLTTDYYHKRAQKLIQKNKLTDAIKVALYEGH